MRRAFLAVAAGLVALPAFAHITPNVKLIERGTFVQQSLPGAAGFFAKDLDLGADALARIRKQTGWTPTTEEVQVYVGRDQGGSLVGSVVFLWIASEHGPVGIGVAFDPQGKILAATVTDVGSEPLTWVRPLLPEGTVTAFAGLGLDTAPDPAQVEPTVKTAMPRYYAKVLAQGVERAQAVEKGVFEPGS
jgi:hypothetical protein